MAEGRIVNQAVHTYCGGGIAAGISDNEVFFCCEICGCVWHSPTFIKPAKEWRSLYRSEIARTITHDNSPKYEQID